MVLDKTREKLNRYYDRLQTGQAEEIKSGHVRQVIAKLDKRESDLLEEIAASSKPSKKARLENKLRTTREQRRRAQWLLDNLD